MTSEISNSQNVIDSREVITRIEELESEREALQEAIEEAKQERADLIENIENCEADNEGEEKSADTRQALKEARQALKDFDEEGSVQDAENELKDFEEQGDGGIELTDLKTLAEQAENCGDWEHGAQLINEDNFTDYIEELIKDCYPMPEGFDEGAWPWRHMVIDYESAAEEARQDYTEVDFAGQAYLIRD